MKVRIGPCAPEVLSTKRADSSSCRHGGCKKTARVAICGAKQPQSGSTRSSHSISSRANLESRRCLQQVDELVHGNPGLSKNRRECSSGKFPVSRDNHRSTFLITKFHVATSPTDLFEANLRKCGDGLLAGNQVARGSRRNQDRGHDRWLKRVGEVLAFKVQTECFFEIRNSIINSLSLTNYVDVEAPRDIPRCFVSDCNGEFHDPNRTSDLCHLVHFVFCAEWALQGSNLRPQPCESVKTLFTRRRGATT